LCRNFFCRNLSCHNFLVEISFLSKFLCLNFCCLIFCLQCILRIIFIFGFLNFNFWPKFWFWPQFRFLTKISIFDHNFNFWPTFQFLTKISIFDQTFGFDLNFDFRPNFPFPTKILFNSQFNHHTFDYWPHILNFDQIRLLTKIVVFWRSIIEQTFSDDVLCYIFGNIRKKTILVILGSIWRWLFWVLFSNFPLETHKFGKIRKTRTKSKIWKPNLNWKRKMVLLIYQLYRNFDHFLGGKLITSKGNVLRTILGCKPS